MFRPQVALFYKISVFFKVNRVGHQLRQWYHSSEVFTRCFFTLWDLFLPLEAWRALVLPALVLWWSQSRMPSRTKKFNPVSFLRVGYRLVLVRMGGWVWARWGLDVSKSSLRIGLRNSMGLNSVIFFFISIWKVTHSKNMYSKHSFWEVNICT